MLLKMEIFYISGLTYKYLIGKNENLFEENYF